MKYLRSFRTWALGLCFAGVLGAVSFAQLIPPGVNSPFQLVWTAVWESSTLKPTYYATSVPFSPASSARVIWQLNGSSTKTIRVRRIIISGSVPVTALAEPIFVNKVTGALPGATIAGTALTPVALDSTQSAATATLEVLTANPTDPTLVGEVLSPVFKFVPSGTAVDVRPLSIEMGEFGSAAFLRSATEALTLNLAGVTTSSSITIGVEWTEE